MKKIILIAFMGTIWTAAIQADAQSDQIERQRLDDERVERQRQDGQIERQRQDDERYRRQQWDRDHNR